MGCAGSRFKARSGRRAHSREGKMSGDAMWHLPDEVLIHILSYLPAEDIARAVSACSQWARVVHNHRGVWHNKSYQRLYECGRGLEEALLVARVLPVLKRVSIYTGYVCSIYLTGESAEFQLPNVHDRVVKSVISSLVTESLLIDFCLLGDTPSNCLLVQPHRLKKLEVCGQLTLQAPDKSATEAKLRALASALSQQRLPDLQSADIQTSWCFLDEEGDVYQSDILAALATCPSLDRVAIQFPCYLSWNFFTKLSKLQALVPARCGIQIPPSILGNTSAQMSNVQVLELRGCVVDDIRFLDLCPQLRNLSIIGCRSLKSRELSHKLRCLLFRNLDVGLGFFDVLRLACSQLQSVVLDFRRHIGHTLPLGPCPQLSFLEVRSGDSDIIRAVDLPSELKHLRLESYVTSDQLEEIIQRLPNLEILDIANTDIYGCHLAQLHHLKQLRRLVLEGLPERYLSLLVEEVRKMPQLEYLSLARNGPNFLESSECRRLLCLQSS